MSFPSRTLREGFPKKCPGGLSIHCPAPLLGLCSPHFGTVLSGCPSCGSGRPKCSSYSCFRECKWYTLVVFIGCYFCRCAESKAVEVSWPLLRFQIMYWRAWEPRKRTYHGAKSPQKVPTKAIPSGDMGVGYPSMQLQPRKAASTRLQPVRE